jgi:hypothetical protein
MRIGTIPTWVVVVVPGALIAIGIIIGRLWRRRSTGKSNRARLSGGQVIGFFGGVLIVAALGGYYAHRDGAATIGFAVIGAGLVVVGAMSERLASGTLRMGPAGAVIPIGEAQIHRGEVVEASVAVQASLGGKGSPTGNAAVPDKAPGSGEKGRPVQPSEDPKAVVVPEDASPVFLTEAANDVLNSLHGAEIGYCTAGGNAVRATRNEISFFKPYATTRSRSLRRSSFEKNSASSGRHLGAKIRLID